MAKRIKENITIQLPIYNILNYDFSELFNNVIENIKGNSIMLKKYEIGIINNAYIKGDKFIIVGVLYDTYIGLENGCIEPYKDKNKNIIQYRFKYKKGIKL